MGVRGIASVQRLRRWAEKKGGHPKAPDGFDRADSGTLAARADAWSLWLECKAYSARTVAVHYWSLRAFLGWAHDRALTRPEMVTKPILESYQRWLWRYQKDDGRPLSVVTQRQRLLAVQHFFAWLCRENHLPSNPAADLILPHKQQELLPRTLSHEEIAAVLAVPDVTDPMGLRDRAILETFYATGVRRTELVCLDLGDVDRSRSTLLVRSGKGGKGRVVPMGEHAAHWLERYLEDCRPLLEANERETALFLTGYGGRYSIGFLGNWVRRTLKKAGVERPGSCHLLRHSCATHMLEGGADIRFIQQLLGHASLETTQIYTQLTIQQLRDVHARCHPRGRRGAAAGLPEAAAPISLPS
jgi:integrase/recombinase XerD